MRGTKEAVDVHVFQICRIGLAPNHRPMLHAATIRLNTSYLPLIAVATWAPHAHRVFWAWPIFKSSRQPNVCSFLFAVFGFSVLVGFSVCLLFFAISKFCPVF
jgi:hypothetical protein